MKTIVAIICIMTINGVCLAHQDESPKASHKGVKVATCKGKDPCKACKNCKYCKLCSKDGGTCGICKPIPEAKTKRRKAGN
jgi:hypothetical protein